MVIQSGFFSIQKYTCKSNVLETLKFTGVKRSK